VLVAEYLKEKQMEIEFIKIKIKVKKISTLRYCMHMIIILGAWNATQHKQDCAKS
jgi:hypothetical protein